MDGLTLLYQLRNLLNELSDSSFLDTQSSYEYLWEAASEFASRSGILRNTQTITTVADQTAYTLNANFESLYLVDKEADFIVKYNDGSNNSFIEWKQYDEIVYGDNTTSVSIPNNFTVIDKSSLASQISSTVTSAGAAFGGQSTLTDTAGDLSDASAGDSVHNVTDGSSGYILSKTSSTVAVTSLFNGTNNDWTSGDAYIIQPQGRLELILDPPPATAGHTITLHYLQSPDPVFSDYGIYRIPQRFMPAIVKYAAWLYKYRDSDPDFGDRWFKFFDRKVKQANKVFGASAKKRKFIINLRNRT